MAEPKTMQEAQAQIRARLLAIIIKSEQSIASLAIKMDINRITLKSFLDGKDVDLVRLGKIVKWIEAAKTI